MVGGSNPVTTTILIQRISTCGILTKTNVKMARAHLPTSTNTSKMSVSKTVLMSMAQCQIGLLFFPLHYFHSFRDGLGVKKSNFFFTNKSVQFLR